MDSINFNNAHFKHLVDSMHLSMSDSMNNVQNVLTQPYDYSKYVSVICSLIIAIGGYYWVALREKKKEEQRLDDIKKHVLTWIHINKLQCIRLGADCEERIKQVLVFNYVTPIQPIVNYKFYFEQIFELNKVDLTKFFIPKDKEGDKNHEKLYLVSNMDNDIMKDVELINLLYSEDIVVLNTTIDNIIDCSMEMEAHFNKFKGTEELCNKIYEAANGKLSYGDDESMFNYNSDVIKLYHSFKNKPIGYTTPLIRKQSILVQKVNNTSTLLIDKFKTISNNFYRYATLLNAIEEYYNGRINNKEFLNETEYLTIKPKHLKMMLLVQ